MLRFATVICAPVADSFLPNDRLHKNFYTLALSGARGVYIDHPFLYGLGAGGRRGVTRALDIIRSELDVTMALTAKRLFADVD
ncbi:alpha-hydroxy-acid oxidizing protein [Paraburkholderia sp. WC7.3d]|uniref:alpha-hydroxy-acid oxidizing protein n=1 Tax=Paraburkholderia sp. WC7.3d TaxID=2991069 RepID=UPI003D2495F8